jgi:hypothetical protein
LDNDVHFLENAPVALVWFVLWDNVGASRERSSLGFELYLKPRGKEAGAFFIPLELGTGSTRFALPVTSAGTKMIDPHFENRSGSRIGHYSRWPEPWRREDDWRPITAALMFFIIVAGLIVFGSGAHL